jgi:hypothetical protein
MTTEFFDKYFKGRKVCWEYDKSISGTIVSKDDDGYVKIDTGSKLYQFPLDQLVFSE